MESVPVEATFPLQEQKKKAPESNINARKTGIVRFIIKENFEFYRMQRYRKIT